MSWTDELAKKIQDAQDGDTIEVDSKAKLELGYRAAGRMKKAVTFVLVEDFLPS